MTGYCAESNRTRQKQLLLEQDNRTIGVVIAGLAGYQPSTVIGGIGAALKSSGFNLMLLTWNLDLDVERNKGKKLLSSHLQLDLTNTLGEGILEISMSSSFQD